MELMIGEVFWLRVTNPRTSDSEVRPVVIYAFEDGNPLIASFATITTSGIEDFDGRFDKWKSPIFKWEEIGLRESSYVKVNCLARVNKIAFSSNEFIGKMERIDLNNAVLKIAEFINSDDEPW